jgi:16S rRNA (guanine527-N7)-methyltransferase
MGIELDSIAKLSALISTWPGLMAEPDTALVEDSLVLLDLIAGDPDLVDVGSGAGLPGLALKLARPGLSLSLVESNRRKAAFLTYACAQLGLEGVQILRLRAEEAGRRPDLRESFDVATARALAAMPVLAELCLPLVRVGGRLLAMKVGAEREVAEAEPVIQLLGGRVVELRPAPTAARSLGQVVVIAKERATPDRFPRRPGLPNRRPLSGNL